VRGRIKQTKRGRPALRRQLFLLAGRWCLTRGLYRTAYVAMLERNGRSRTKAVCAIARKLVPMLLHVMQTGEPFDVPRWCAAHGVPVPPPAPDAATKSRRRRAKAKAATHHGHEAEDTPYRAA
jgi:hypothetical protein